MSKSTISTFQLFEMFPDEQTARAYLEDRLWPNGAVCPQCKSGERITSRSKGGFKHCNACKFDFTVRTGTIFGRSHIPLHKWVYAMYLLVTARKGISSLQLAKEIGVTQHSAWFMLQRLREACSTPDSIDKLKGIIEIDEAFFGGKDANKHAHLRGGSRGGKGKVAVLGMRQRGGHTRGMVIADRTLHTIQQEIHKNVEVGATIFTDESPAYADLNGLFFRADSVNHSQGEYAKGICNTNSIESVWAVLKRGIYGVYHQVSAKHLARYVDEFAFRLNEGNVARHSIERLNSFVDAVAGKRITLKQVTA
jgi:transposase-like protein